MRSSFSTPGAATRSNKPLQPTSGAGAFSGCTRSRAPLAAERQTVRRLGEGMRATAVVAGLMCSAVLATLAAC